MSAEPLLWHQWAFPYLRDHAKVTHKTYLGPARLFRPVVPQGTMDMEGQRD